jgi:hypothetical protein
MKLEHEHHDTTKPHFTQFVGFLFSHNSYTETRNIYLNDLTTRKTQTERRTEFTSHLHVHYIREKVGRMLVTCRLS